MANGVTLGLLVDHYPGEAHGFAWMKVDCEGCEYPFLSSPATIDVAVIVGEHHRGIDGIRELLDSHDVELVTGTEGFGTFRAVRRATSSRQRSWTGHEHPRAPGPQHQRVRPRPDVARAGTRRVLARRIPGPRQPPVDARPPLPQVPAHPDLAALVDAVPSSQMSAKEHIPDGVLDWADAIVVEHYPAQWVFRGGTACGACVIWRTCGQSDEPLERIVGALHRQGLEIVRWPRRARTSSASGCSPARTR
ncbi:MAG: hypothetical protein U0667_15285 [Chloroflexota bacterium]